MPDKLNITICMGSSCYSRGNRRTLEVIQKLLEEQPAEEAELVGHLCENHCLQGPNLRIADKDYHAVDPASVTQLLHHHLKREGP
jgi:NADH:ubiquinone oxidoreductase subunit E